MRCYYEILQVDQNATDDELKKGYRKLALKCHPDKNLGREDDAAEEFKEVVNAYTNLSDPQLRAFYDRNKDNILRENDSKSSQSRVPNVFAFFRNCYSGGFTDSDNGFYAVYREFFQDLYNRDRKYMADNAPEAPNFGDMYTEHQDVAQFYGYWSSYHTSMPFAWADQIDVLQASNRWMEKKIDAENAKFREKERKDFNERVRNLVLHVRKRDPRWKDYTQMLKEKSAAAVAKQEEQQQRLHRQRQEQIEADSKDEGLMRAKREYLQQLRAMERNMNDGEEMEDEVLMEDLLEGDCGEEDELQEDEDDDMDLVCPVCIKLFTNERNRELHMKTKKHKQNVAQFLEEQALLNGEQLSDPAEEIDESEVTAEPQMSVPEQAEFSEPEQVIPVTSQNKKNKKKRKLDKKMEEIRRKQLQQYGSDTDNEEDDYNNKSTADNNQDELCTQTENITIADDCNEQNSADQLAASLLEATSAPAPHDEQNYITPAPPEPKSKLLNAKQSKKKSKPTKQMQPPPSHCGEDDVDASDTACRICNAEFKSKNKLFQHIKATGHAVLKTTSSSAGKKGKSKRK